MFNFYVGLELFFGDSVLGYFAFNNKVMKMIVLYQHEVFEECWRPVFLRFF